MVALIQSENHAANKGKTAGRYQFDAQPTGIGLIILPLTLINPIETRDAIPSKKDYALFFFICTYEEHFIIE